MWNLTWERNMNKHDSSFYYSTQLQCWRNYCLCLVSRTIILKSKVFSTQQFYPGCTGWYLVGTWQHKYPRINFGVLAKSGKQQSRRIRHRFFLNYRMHSNSIDSFFRACQESICCSHTAIFVR